MPEASGPGSISGPAEAADKAAISADWRSGIRQARVSNAPHRLHTGCHAALGASQRAQT
jgi:hypothetical protein